MLVSMKQTGLYTVAANEDKVMGAWPMPPGSRLVNVKGHIDFGPQAPIAFDAVLASAITAFVLPVVDPDAAADVDSIWDKQVPKDEAEADDAIDLDTGTADPTPEWEPGVPDLVSIIGLDQAPEWFGRETWMTINTHPTNIHKDTTEKYWPGQVVNIDAQPRIGTQLYSIAMIAFSSPVATVVVATARNAPTKQQWGMLMFLETSIENMMQSLFSFPEAGQEQLYEDMSTYMGALTEPAVEVESTRANDFTPLTFNVNVRLTAQVMMPEKGAPSNLSSG